MELIRYIMLAIRALLATAVIAGVLGSSAAMASGHPCWPQELQISMHIPSGSHNHSTPAPASEKLLCCSSVCMLCSVVEAADKFQRMPARFVAIRFIDKTSFPAGCSTPPDLGPPRNTA